MFAPQTLGFPFLQALRYHTILAHKNVLGIKISRETSLPALNRLGFLHPARSL